MTKYIAVFLKGLAMGAADVVPGVSGGTIAFITGIYDTLLDSIDKINFGLIKKLKNEGIVSVWNHINGAFLLSLFAGILTSILSLAKVIKMLLHDYPISVWSFFFGLIIASIVYLLKELKQINIKSIIGLILGTIFVIFLSQIPGQKDASNLLYIFFCGMVAICAMILPGISGSFILLVLGAYTTVFIEGLANRDVLVLGIFGLGAITGLLSFSKFLKWILNTYRNTTFAVLIGFLVGSLYKIWPWKHIEEIFVKHIGEPNEAVVNIVEKNVLPSNYDTIVREGANIVGYAKQDPQVMQAVIFCIVGFSIIFVIEGLGKLKGKAE